MRGKWVILAAVVLFGAAGFIVMRGAKAGYPFEGVSAVFYDHGASRTVVITESRIEMPVFRKRADPYGLRKAIDWVKYDLLGYDPFANHATYPAHFSTDGTGFSSITAYGKNGMIHEVVIYAAKGTPEGALEIQAKLSKEFPELPCKIKKPVP